MQCMDLTVELCDVYKVLQINETCTSQCSLCLLCGFFCFGWLTASLVWWLRHLPWEWKNRGSISVGGEVGGGFSGSIYTSDLEIGTPVAALPGTWHKGSVYSDWVS